MRGEHDGAIGRQDKIKDAKQNRRVRQNRQREERIQGQVEWVTKIGGQAESSGQKETKRGSKGAESERKKVAGQRYLSTFSEELSGRRSTWIMNA